MLPADFNFLSPVDRESHLNSEKPQDRLNWAISIIDKYKEKGANALAANISVLGKNITDEKYSAKLDKLIELISKKSNCESDVLQKYNKNNTITLKLINGLVKYHADIANRIKNSPDLVKRIKLADSDHKTALIGDIVLSVLESTQINNEQEIDNILSLIPEEISDDRYFKIITALIENSNTAADNVAQNMDKLRLEKLSTYRKALLTCQLIKKTPNTIKYSEIDLVKTFKFEQLPDNDLQNIGEHMITEMNFASQVAIYNFERLKLDKLPDKQLQKMGIRLILMSNLSGISLADNFEKFKLDKLPDEELHDIGKSLASTNDVQKSIVLFCLFDKLRLDKLPEKDLQALGRSQLLISSRFLVTIVMDNFRQLKLDRLPEEELHDLAKSVIKKGNGSIFFEENNFISFRLNTLSHDRLYEMFKLMAEQGTYEIKNILECLNNHLQIIDENELKEIIHCVLLNKTNRKEALKELINALGKWQVDIKTLFPEFESYFGYAEQLSAKRREDREFIRNELFNFLKYAAISIYGSPLRKQKTAAKIIKGILDYNDPENRYAIIDQLITINEEQWDIFRGAALQTAFMNIPALLLANFIGKGLDKKTYGYLITKGTKNQLKNTKNLKKLIDFLLAVGKHDLDIGSFLFKSGKELNLITKAAGFNYRNLEAITSYILCFGKEATEQVLKSDTIDFEGGFVQKIIEIFNLKMEPHVVLEKYNETFKKFRDPLAIFTYASHLGVVTKVDNKEKKKVSKALSRYVSLVLNKELQKERYNTKNNPHLRLIFQSFPYLRDAWNNPLEPEKISFHSDSVIENINFRHLFESTMKDNHLKADQNIHLRKYFAKGEYAAICRDIRSEIDKTADYDRKKILNMQLKIVELSEKSENSDFTPENRIALLREIYDLIPQEEYNFRNEIAKIIEAIHIPFPKGEYTLLETDDPCDLLLVGTETKSCQSVDGYYEWNKCLLGYILDGKNRVVAIKNARGTIVARSIIKLLWDSTNKKPVILQEASYNNYHSYSLMNKIINRRCLRIAQKLKLPLLSSSLYCKLSKCDESPYKGTIQAFAGPAPFEYSDVMGGIYKKGHYSADNLSEVINYP